MNTHLKVQAIQQKAHAAGKRWAPFQGAYPTDVLDLIIFHKLHLSMPLENALKSFHNLKTAFVDWNEVRVSTVREIQDALPGNVECLSIAVFIKELLEFVHREQQDVSLEFLMEQNLGEIRRYLKQVRGLDSSTVNLILRVRKEHPVLPLNRAMEAVLDRLGVLSNAETRDRRERALHDLVEPEKALAFHHFLLNHSQQCCPIDEANVDCPRCCMRQLCAFHTEAMARRRRKANSRHSRSDSAVVSRSMAVVSRSSSRIRTRGSSAG